MATKTKSKAKPKPKAKAKPAPAKKTSIQLKAAAKKPAAKKPSAPKAAATPPASPAPQVFCWHEVATTDVPAAKAFYTGLFGWTTQDVPMGASTYTLLKVGPKEIAGLYPMTGPEWEGKNVPPHWMTYVAVSDVDASANKAAGLGGKIVHPPTDIPGIGRFSVLEDPKGAVFSIFRPLQA